MEVHMANISYWFDDLMNNPQNTIRLYSGTDNSTNLVAIAPYVPSNLRFSINNNWSKPGELGIDVPFIGKIGTGTTAAALNQVAELGRFGATVADITGNLLPGARALFDSIGETKLGEFIQSGINKSYSSLTDEIYKFNGSNFSFNIPTLTCIYYHGFNYGGSEGIRVKDWVQKIVNVAAGKVDTDSITGSLVRVVEAPNQFTYSVSDASNEGELKGTLTMCIGGKDLAKTTDKSNTIYINNLVVSSLNVTYSDEYVNESDPLYALVSIQLQRVRATFPSENNLNIFGLTSASAKSNGTTGKKVTNELPIP